jgi:hypothetical protein
VEENNQPNQTIIPVQPSVNALTQAPSSKRSFPKLLITIIVFLILVVGSVGSFYFINIKKQAELSSTTPTPTESLSPASTDKTVNWKTYKNTEYGIELKYPADLLVEREIACPKEYSYPNEIVNLFIKSIKDCTPDMPSPLAIYQPNSFSYPTSEDECYVVKEDTIAIDNTEAIRYTTTFNPNNSKACLERGLGPPFLKQTDIFLDKDGKNFRIIYGSGDGMIGVDDITEETLIKIVSTIKFTDETANWKTYTGDGFTFKYPQDYPLQKWILNKDGITFSEGKGRMEFVNKLYTFSQNECQGGGCLTGPTKKVKINEYDAIKTTSSIGVEGGMVPQSFISYEIKKPNEEKYFFIKLWELTSEEEKKIEIVNAERKTPEKSVSIEDTKILEKILSTFKFTD